MKLLLTGATGFVGRNFLLAARERCEVIYTPVRNTEKLLKQLKEENIPTSKIRPLSAEPSEWPDDITPTHALHSAGVLFARSRHEYFQTNVEWTQRLLSALRPDCRVSVLSSLSAGGPTPKGSASRKEEHPDAPITWYGESKLEMEKMILNHFPDRRIVILRPPMILGPRDTATIPLFQMAGGLIRTKPGLKTKTYSWIGVEDLVAEIFLSFAVLPASPFYLATDQTITDWQLIAAAAEARGASGITLPIPQPLMRLLAALVDAIPQLRARIPSLTRDRAREIWCDRWVVDPSKWRALSANVNFSDLSAVLRATWEHTQKDIQ